ncbi:DUF3822 family protein [Carboxylicivirga mesophila]|uniref:DUF3822 family protein n=1 Tax=Carboxylicivirga mesophila TaxID=1166478 RepID=A0ABS5K7B1_9BACT|nr:DUF3822 family protein [Carboxylicivirga mesophila]MBS2210850.1 DUF3822 family protein [Carboxylicivirga mesophila]
MTKTYVVDPSFDASITTSYFLSIRSSSGGLSFCVLDPVTNTYIAFANIPFVDTSKDNIKTQEVLLKEELLQLPYKKVFFLYESAKATLVPTALYDSGRYAELYSLNHSKEEAPIEIVAQKIKMADAWNLFSIPQFMYHLVKTQFESIEFYQHYSPFVEACLIASQQRKQETVMHIGIHDKFFDVLVIRDRKMALCNSYAYSNINDFLYFVLFTFEQLKLEADKTNVLVHGLSDKQNPLYKELKNYLRQAKTVAPTPHFKFSHGMRIKESDKLMFHNLFNLAICV